MPLKFMRPKVDGIGLLLTAGTNRAARLSDLGELGDIRRIGDPVVLPENHLSVTNRVTALAKLSCPAFVVSPPVAPSPAAHHRERIVRERIFCDL